MLQISNATCGRRCDWRTEQTSLAFAKTGVTAITLLRLVPGSSYFSLAAHLGAVWDISAAASQCRNLIEAYYVLCYLVHEPSDEPSREFQRTLWEYHEEFERHEMLRIALPDSMRIPEVAKELAARRVLLEKTAVFRSLSKGHQADLTSGKSFKIESSIELSRKAGISENYYRAEYKYCSAYIHSAPFSIGQLRDFTSASEGAQHLFKTLVQLATGYSALAIRDFASRFPDARSHIAAEVVQTIRFWEELMKWDKLPEFRQAP